MLSAVQISAKEPAEYVNPFIGASNDVDASGTYHGLGKTFPGAATPFGMTQLSPQTIHGGDNGSGYSYEHRTIEGFSMTQMSGVGWFGDLGNFTVMPTTDKLVTFAGKEGTSTETAGWRSAYDKDSEVARANYYGVRLTDYDIKNGDYRFSSRRYFPDDIPAARHLEDIDRFGPQSGRYGRGGVSESGGRSHGGGMDEMYSRVWRLGQRRRQRPLHRIFPR